MKMYVEEEKKEGGGRRKRRGIKITGHEKGH